MRYCANLIELTSYLYCCLKLHSLQFILFFCKIIIISVADGFCTFGFPELECNQEISCSSDLDCQEHRDKFATSFAVCSRNDDFPEDCGNGDCFWVTPCIFDKNDSEPGNKNLYKNL